MTSLTDRTTWELDARIAAEQTDGRLPSLVAGVVRDGALAWFGSRGQVDGAPPTPDTQYRIGSITKTFTAVGVMRLRDEGVVSLRDPVVEHVAEAPPGVTVGELLSHSSGMQAETDLDWWERTPGPDWAGLAPSVTDRALRLAPGERFHYSNLAFAVLGQLVAAHRGMPWTDAVQAEILDPLGMDRTTMRPAAPAAPGLSVHPHADVVLRQPEHDAGALAPAGQLWSTIDDLVRWAAFLAGDTGDVLDPDTLAEMRRPRAVVDVDDEPWTAAMGLGLQVWNRDGRRTVGHGGSMPGFLAVLSVDPEDGTGILVATNSTAGMTVDLVPDLHGIVREHEPPPTPEAWEPADVPADVLDLTGTWFWGPRPHVLRVTGEREITLGPAEGPGRRSRFVPADGPDRWVGLDNYYAGEPLRVVRDDGGNVTHLDLASFVFTRRPYAPGDVVPGGVDPSGWGTGPG